MEHFLHPWAQFGIVGVFCGSIIFILWRMIVWVMAFVKDTIEQHNKERATWMQQFTEVGNMLNKVCTSFDKHDERAEERGRYVREDHKEFQKQITEVTNVLGRLNGYKDATH